MYKLTAEQYIHLFFKGYENIGRELLEKEALEKCSPAMHYELADNIAQATDAELIDIIKARCAAQEIHAKHTGVYGWRDRINYLQDRVSYSPSCDKIEQKQIREQIKSAEKHIDGLYAEIEKLLPIAKKGGH